MRRAPRQDGRAAVSSRRRALDRLRAAIEEDLEGPVLITGEAGAGKTWLARRFAEGLPAGWRAIDVELTSALDGPEMIRMIGAGLGLAMPERLGAARSMIAEALRDASAEGRTWLLIVDRAHVAAAGAWEELEALSDRLGRAGGFGAILLLGRTELAREMAAKPRDGWAHRLSLHIHLPPLDLDEARELLAQDGRLAGAELEAIHRDALGNPRAMLRIAGSRSGASRQESSPPRPVDARARSTPFPRGESRPDQPGGEGFPAFATGVAADEGSAPRLPSLIPARPPIRIEEGLVEVGWEGDLESEPTRREGPGPTTSDPDPGEELVEDRYAALQAWAEWSRNRERPATNSPLPVAEIAIETAEDHASPPGPARPASADPDAEPAPAVRAEASHDFAPYGQLFSRLRHSW